MELASTGTATSQKESRQAAATSGARTPAARTRYARHKDGSSCHSHPGGRPRKPHAAPASASTCARWRKLKGALIVTLSPSPSPPLGVRQSTLDSLPAPARLQPANAGTCAACSRCAARAASKADPGCSPVRFASFPLRTALRRTEKRCLNGAIAVVRFSPSLPSLLCRAGRADATIPRAVAVGVNGSTAIVLLPSSLLALLCRAGRADATIGAPSTKLVQLRLCVFVGVYSNALF